ncbi:MAG TPA: LuxR C-terminal-related transcriptional regulator [Vicinamibacteria bacterium]|nr:LuxR C-terminal-related transcriptional regulator [Vicinamibacteria bacterium]
MARFESLRVVPTRRESRPLDTTGDWSPRVAGDLLDVLAAGEPAAFATDSRHRVVFWNSGAARVFGWRSEEAIGKHCYEVIAGRDVFGNRFCYQACPVSMMARAEEPIRGFEMEICAKDGAEASLQVTVIRLAGPRPDLFTLVHMLHPVDTEARLARAVDRLASTTPPERVAEVRPSVACAAPSNGRTVLAPRGNGSGMEAPPLTPREKEVLRCVAQGLQNKEIAQKLDLSLATVRNHVHNTLEKLGVHSKLEAVSLAFRSGWVSEETN